MVDLICVWFTLTHSLVQPCLFPQYPSIMIIGDRSRLLVVGQDMFGFLFDDGHQPSLAWDLLRNCTRKTPIDSGLGDDDEDRTLQDGDCIYLSDIASVLLDIYD